MKKWKNIKIEEQLMKDIEKVKNEKPEEFKSKSKFLEDAVNEKLKRIRDEDMKYNFAAIQEFLEKNAVTLRRKGIDNMLDLTSQTLSNTEDIRKLEMKLLQYKVVEIYDEAQESSMKKFEKDNPVFTKEINDYVAKKTAAMNKGLTEILKRSEKQN